MAIKAVCFDLDDTLLWDDRSVDEAFKATCETANKACGVDTAQLEEAVKSAARELYASYETFPFTQNIGINPFEGLWGDFKGSTDENFRKMEALVPGYRKDAWTNGLKALGIDDPALGLQLGEQFAAERRSRPYVYEETYQILDALKGKVKLLLLTNGSPDLQQEKLAGVPKLPPYFDVIMISGDHGEGKPAPSIFNKALDNLGVSADEALMVGDKLATDIKGANGVGIRSVWINRKQLPESDEIIPVYRIEHLMELPGIIDSIE